MEAEWRVSGAIQEAWMSSGPGKGRKSKLSLKNLAGIYRLPGLQVASSSVFVLSRSVVSDSLRPHGLYPTRLLYPWGFSRQKYWSGLPRPPSGDLPNPGIEPRSPALQAVWATKERKPREAHALTVGQKSNDVLCESVSPVWSNLIHKNLRERYAHSPVLQVR